MTALTVCSAILCGLALAYLGAVLHRRYPSQPHEPGSWKPPLVTTRWAGREPVFDRTVNRIEKAKLTRPEWEDLMSHLDAIADELDPGPPPGTRRVVPFDRGHRIWVSIDRRSGAPKAYDRHYFDARLTAIEQRNGGTQHG